MAKTTNFQTIEEYIKTFPVETQQVLEKLRQTIKTVIPDAEDAISYQIPTFKLNGKYVIYFAGYANHVSIYPVHPDEVSFASELKPYASGKATLQFPLSKPIPYALVKKIVEAKAAKQVVG